MSRLVYFDAASGASGDMILGAVVDLGQGGAGQLAEGAVAVSADLLEVVEEKIKLNEEKYPADKVRGSSKKYSEY